MLYAVNYMRKKGKVSGLDLLVGEILKRRTVSNALGRGRVPGLSQIIEPEIDNIKRSRIKPRPHPPFSRPKVNLAKMFKPRNRF